MPDRCRQATRRGIGHLPRIPVVIIARGIMRARSDVPLMSCRGTVTGARQIGRAGLPTTLIPGATSRVMTAPAPTRRRPRLCPAEGSQSHLSTPPRRCSPATLAPSRGVVRRARGHGRRGGSVPPVPASSAVRSERALRAMRSARGRTHCVSAPDAFLSFTPSCSLPPSPRAKTWGAKNGGNSAWPSAGKLVILLEAQAQIRLMGLPRARGLSERMGDWIYTVK